MSVNELPLTQCAAYGTDPAIVVAFPHGKASSASLPHPLLVKVKYWWISITDYSPVITWWFCSGCSISVRARRCLCQQLSCTDLTGTKAGDHQWHTPGSLPSPLCTISHGSCSTGTRLATPNRLWEHKDGKFLVLSSTESSGSSSLSYRTRPSLPRLKAFPGEVTQHEITQSTLFLDNSTLPFPLLNDIFLIPNLCVLGCVYLLLLFK